MGTEKKMLPSRILFAFIVIFLSIVFVFDGQKFHFGQEATIEEIVMLKIPKPYAYRALVPALSRAVMIVFGATAEVSLYAVMLVFAIGAGYAIKSLFRLFWDDEIKAGFHAILCLLLLHAMIYWLKKPYDLSTIFLFPLAALLIHKKSTLYLILFPLIVLSRETAFLLSFLYFLYERDNWKKPTFGLAMAYQVFVFFAIYFVLRGILAQNAGHDFVRLYAWYVYLVTPIMVIIGAAFIWSIRWLYEKRDNLPPIVWAGVIVFVAQVILHLLLGFAFEFRVLAETFPLLYAAYALSLMRH